LIFSHFFLPFFNAKKNHISITVKDFVKSPTGQEPRDLKLEAQVISKKESSKGVISQINNENKNRFACKLSTVREKNKIK
jgi:hypothetical protein